ncbi:MAG: PQQ-dependent sugar dehydrogenase [Gemmatimonadales bacterium]
MSKLARSVSIAIVPALLACGSKAAPAQGQDYSSKQGTIRLVTVATGLEHPWGLAFLPDGRMLVTERPGRLRIVSADGRISEPLSGVPAVYAEGQGGLLDVAVAPDFATSRNVYLTFSEPGEGGNGTALARGRLGERGLEDTQVLWRQSPKVTGGAHYGSRIVFTRDGNLFVTTGDRRKGDPAQDLTGHIGKVIRLRLDGNVPRDNPYVGRSDAKPEIWSAGHRNAQGATLHPGTGQLWTAEHGSMGGDEINTPRAGRNYGWPVITYGRDYSGARIGEGSSKPGLEQPVHYWDPSIAPSGMVFYTGDKFPAWRGNLFVGSLKFGWLVRFDVNGERVSGEERLLDGFRQRIRDVRQGPDGYIYMVTDEGNGRILRLEPAARQ